MLLPSHSSLFWFSSSTPHQSTSSPSMEVLISASSLNSPFPLRFPTRFPLDPRPLRTKTPPFLRSIPSLKRRWRRFPVLRSISAPPDRFASKYGGWDELELINSPSISSKPDPLRSLLISIGIHDRWHAFLFILGFISALAISRIRLSSMVVFPVSALVFVIGFSSGVARTGRTGENFDEKLKNLGEFFDRMDAKMAELRNGLGEFSGSDQLVMEKIKSFTEVVEDLRLDAGAMKKTVEDFIDGDLASGYLGFGSEGGKKSNQKLGRKRREFGQIGYELARFLGSVIHENLVALKPSKVKDTTKEEVNEKFDSVAQNDANSINEMREKVACDGAEERDLNALPNNNVESSKVEEFEEFLGMKEKERSVPDNAKNVKKLVDDGIPIRSTSVSKNRGKSYDSRDGRYVSDMLSYDGEFGNVNRSFHFTSKQGSSRKMVFQQKYGANQGINGRPLESDLDFFTAESEASSLFEERLEICDRSFLPSYGSNSSKFKVEQPYNVGYRGAFESPDCRPVKGNQGPTNSKDGLDGLDMPSSSTVSADEEFNQNVDEASGLLKQARQLMMGKASEETVDSILYRTSSLLSTAVAMKPMSLLAVGQLGNTYLLHGELKLKISRELRSLLSKGGDLLHRKERRLQFKKLDISSLNKELVASVLVDVCEECEALLVKAGRTYRMALSIDGHDVRALYNWGLALFFRAQLIADIGPETASDADKVYLAAIDKFDAMLLRSNAYAPDALYRWGTALQLRSRLRPRNSREKMKLLQQAKSLFEDVLSLKSDDQQARDALSLCISELKL